MSIKARQLLPLSALTLLLLSQGAAASVIDDFTVSQGAECAATGDNRLCVSGGKDNKFSYVNGGMLSGQRDIHIESNSGAGSSSVHVRDGKFTWSNNTDAESKVIIQWDGKDKGNGNDITGQNADQALAYENKLGNKDNLYSDGIYHDFTAGGSNSGLMLEVSTPEAGFNYELLLTDKNGNVAIFDGPSSNSDQMLSFLFKDFTDEHGNLLGSNDFDFTQVDAFQLSLESDNKNSSIDFALDGISTIPEPGNIAIFATALLGAGAACRRRQNQQKK